MDPSKNRTSNGSETSYNSTIEQNKGNDNSKLNQDRNIPKKYEGALSQNERYRAAIDNLREFIDKAVEKAAILYMDKEKSL